MEFKQTGMCKFIKNTNKVNCPKNRVEKVSHIANIIKVGLINHKSKALAYKLFLMIQKAHFHSKNED